MTRHWPLFVGFGFVVGLVVVVTLCLVWFAVDQAERREAAPAPFAERILKLEDGVYVRCILVEDGVDWSCDWDGASK